MSDQSATKSFWVSWYSTREMGTWTLKSPWWISGYRNEENGGLSQIVCAALRAPSEEKAKRDVMDAYLNSFLPRIVKLENSDFEWRFCEERDDHWSPFNDRFQRREGMHWTGPRGVLADERPFVETLDTKKMIFFNYHEDEDQASSVEDLMQAVPPGEWMTVVASAQSKPMNMKKVLIDGQEVILTEPKESSDVGS